MQRSASLLATLATIIEEINAEIDDQPILPLTTPVRRQTCQTGLNSATSPRIDEQISWIEATQARLLDAMEKGLGIRTTWLTVAR